MEMSRILSAGGGQTPHWGPLATLLWSVPIVAFHVLCSGVFVAVYVALTQRGLTPEQLEKAMLASQSDGMAISLATLLTALLSGALIAGVVKLKRGASLKDYLGFAVPARADIVKWTLILLVFLALSDTITYLLGKAVVPPFMLDIYTSTPPPRLWLLAIALIVAAPFVEELFFRGFVMRGLAASFVGPAGAAVLSSAAWALIHSQYDSYGIGLIFLTGLILGAARIKTGSIVLTMYLHGLANLIALAETIVVFNLR